MIILLIIPSAHLLSSCTSSSDTDNLTLIEQACTHLKIAWEPSVSDETSLKEYEIAANLFRELSANSPEYDKYAVALGAASNGEWYAHSKDFYSAADFCGIPH